MPALPVALAHPPEQVRQVLAAMALQNASLAFSVMTARCRSLADTAQPLHGLAKT
jgi:hypothetical protein